MEKVINITNDRLILGDTGCYVSFVNNSIEIHLNDSSVKLFNDTCSTTIPFYEMKKTSFVKGKEPDRKPE